MVLQVTSAAIPGTSVNHAEISADNGDDIDSLPDTNSGNDPGGQPGSPADDATGGDGTGPVGGNDPNTDEDDHDPAEVTVETYDLALTKVYTSDDYNTTNDGVVAPGALVTFTITVINQGSVAAAGVQVTDYMPAGFTFPSGNATNTSNGWSLVAGNPTATIANLAASGNAGDTVVLQLVLQVGTSASAGSAVNRAEISADDGVDIDSTTDTIAATTPAALWVRQRMTTPAVTAREHQAPGRPRPTRMTKIRRRSRSSATTWL